MTAIIKILTTCSLTLLMFVSALHAEENFDFRSTRWGMTKEEVKSSEKTTPYHESENAVSYANIHIINESTGTLTYIFENGRMVSSSYIISIKRYSDAIKSFDMLRIGLTRKYSQAYSIDACCPSGNMDQVLSKLKQQKGTAMITLNFANDRTNSELCILEANGHYTITIIYHDKIHLHMLHKKVMDNVFGDPANL